MKMAAKIAVMRDRPVVAPRAPKTVPDAPAPKPAPASAPLPLCNNTSATMASAEITCRIVRIVRIFMYLISSASGGDDREELFGLQRGAADEPAVHVGHRKKLRGIRGFDAAAVLD